MPKENNNIRFLEKSDEYLYISKEGMEEILKGKEIENSGKNIYWTTDYTIELPIRMKKKGYGLKKSNLMLFNSKIYLK